MISTPPDWALTAAYWMHMLATVFWLGGLAVYSFFIIPLSERQPDSPHIADLTGSFERRLNAVGWFSILVLLASGMLQMSSNPNYIGFLSLSGRWAYAILIKHIFFAVMVAVNGWLTWGVNPAIRRARLLSVLGKQVNSLQALQAKHNRLIQFNLAVGGVILVFTAIARVTA
jgi:uncharacterized membrane protein